jgi:predicted PurR-regulated permease PerM
MAVIALLGNGILQQIVQPFAYGAALDLHPIVVLVLTIGAGCLFGTIGLILAAPVTSAIVRITRELREAQSPPATPGPQPQAA